MKSNKTMKKVMCFGTFDVFHLGHLNYFEQARGYGDYLIVVVARDKTKHAQKKETIFDEVERLKLVKSINIVDEAVLGYPDNHYTIIQEKRPDVICLGYDQAIKEQDLSQRLRELGLSPIIMRMKSYQTHLHKSSLIKRHILSRQ